MQFHHATTPRRHRARGGPLAPAQVIAAGFGSVTGLIVVDTPTYWSTFGTVVIMLLIQVGGLGIMLFAALVGLAIIRKMSVRSRITVGAEVKEGSGDMKRIVGGIVATSLIIEAATMILLTGRFMVGYGYDWPTALWHGLFHAVSAFTNAGFALYSDSLMPFVSDPWICLPISAAIILGGGPAGTADGIKVTTFAVLLFIMWTELRGSTAVNSFGKRLSRGVHREAIAVVVIAIGAIMAVVIAVLATTDFDLDQVLFEAISAFGTVGMSTGMTADLPEFAQVLLILLLFLGRLGPLTLGSALALRERRTAYELPKERPVVG